jgi:hypothetical protein
MQNKKLLQVFRKKKAFLNLKGSREIQSNVWVKKIFSLIIYFINQLNKHIGELSAKFNL